LSLNLFEQTTVSWPLQTQQQQKWMFTVRNSLLSQAPNCIQVRWKFIHTFLLIFRPKDGLEMLAEMTFLERLKEKFGWKIVSVAKLCHYHYTEFKWLRKKNQSIP